jgi:hypothetical protein
MLSRPSIPSMVAPLYNNTLLLSPRGREAKVAVGGTASCSLGAQGTCWHLRPLPLLAFRTQVPALDAAPLGARLLSSLRPQSWFLGPGGLEPR